MKKFISLLLAVMMVISILPVSAIAEMQGIDLLPIGAQEEQPAEEQPAEEQPAEEQPAEEQPTEEQPAEEQPTEEQPAEQPAAEPPAETQAAANRTLTIRSNIPEAGLTYMPLLTFSYSNIPVYEDYTMDENGTCVYQLKNGQFYFCLDAEAGSAANQMQQQHFDYSSELTYIGIKLIMGDKSYGPFKSTYNKENNYEVYDSEFADSIVAAFDGSLILPKEGFPLSTRITPYFGKPMFELNATVMESLIIEVCFDSANSETERLINEIGRVCLDNGSDERIAAARASYDALPEEGKANIRNYDILTAAEEIYQGFIDEQEEWDNTPSITFTSNAAWSVQGTGKTPNLQVVGVEEFKGDEAKIIKNKAIQVSIGNYKEIYERFPLDYVEIDGLNVPFDLFTSELKEVNTSSCPNLKGRKTEVRGGGSKTPYIKIYQAEGDNVTSSFEIKFIFKNVEEPKYKLTAIAGENGQVYEARYLYNTDNGSMYALYVRPDDNYQLYSYTMDGKENIFDFTFENYKSWKNPNRSTRVRAKDPSICNYFELEIDKDTEVKMNFTPAEVVIELIGCRPNTTSLSLCYGFSSLSCDLQDYIKRNGYSWEPLVEGAGIHLKYFVHVKGFLRFDDNKITDPARIKACEIYGGTEKNDESLIFSMDDPKFSLLGIIPADPHAKVNSTLEWSEGVGSEAYTVYTGMWTTTGEVWAPACPKMDCITTEMEIYGRTLTMTVDVQMASDVGDESGDFIKYYTETYGLDKMGGTAYTEEEKQTEGYKLYCQYSTFRYVLRKVYNEQLKLITKAENPAAALAEAKAALDAAARGEGCNAVSWSFTKNSTYGTHSKPTLVAIPNDGDNSAKTGTSASDAICAALEAEYPGNWSYCCTATQFGMFVNKVTAGGEDDVGSTKMRTYNGDLGGNYGFWYYNGKFSEWGVSNYYPSDGDVMAWGNPDVTQTWNQAILRFHYKNIGGDDALDEAMKAKGVTFESTTEELEQAFPDINFSRKGQFRTTTAYEEVMDLIKAIGSIAPGDDSAIIAAREAYEALSDEDKALVKNYNSLVEAEEAYKKMMDPSGISYTEALAGSLAKLKMINPSNVNTDSVNGAWLVFALARGGVISGEDCTAVSGPAQSFMTRFKVENLKQTTDFARATIGATSLGVVVPDGVLEELCNYDKAAEQGINAVAYALLALNTRPYEKDNTEIRNKYIAYMLENACNNGGWVYGNDKESVADVDMTAMVIQSLAPYYGANNAVKAAVDKGLEALKSMQQVTGGFSSFGTYNAESIAQVIVALTELGIDPTSDEWKTENGDPVEALLRFYNKETNMFRHAVYGADDQMATEQATYALVAYNRFKKNQNTLYDMSDVFGENGDPTDPAQIVSSAYIAIQSIKNMSVPMSIANTIEAVEEYVTDVVKIAGGAGPNYIVSVGSGDFKAAVAGNKYNPNGQGGKFIADVTISLKGESKTIRLYGTITATKYEAPKPDITVTFKLYGDTHHTIEADADIHSYRFNAETLPVWIDTVEVTVPAGSTVGTVFQKVLDEKGFTYEGLSGGYISSISQPNGGITLEHKADGRGNSGWMYLVNSKHPNVGLNSYELSAGDNIVWHWTDDYQIEEGSEEWNASRVTEYIEGLINAIGTPITVDSKTAIDIARNAYDKLTPEQKAKISNYEKLTAAEAEYARLAGVPGDVNGDGAVDSRDAIRLSKYLAKMDVEIVLLNADVTGDGKVNTQDLIRLKKYLAKMPIELG